MSLNALAQLVFRSALRMRRREGSVMHMRALTVLSLALLVVACSPKHDARIVGSRAPVEKDFPAVQNAPGGEALAAGIRAYDVGDHERALKYFRAAADEGLADAQYYTGLMYSEGEGTPHNYAEAAKWYEKAGAQNQPDALFALAKLYVIGGGVPADAAKAIELYERAEKALPPGEKRDQAAEQRTALAAVVSERQDAANTPAKTTP
jgi:TPR repeat protein